MPENQDGKFRHRRVNFAPVSNAALQDDRLSLKAKGLYSLIQCYITKPNFDLYKRALMKLCKEGSKAFDAAWKELKDAGYLKIYRIPRGVNDTFEYEYELLDEPNENIPSLINLNKKREVVVPKSKSPEQVPPQSDDGWHIPQNGGDANHDNDSQNSSHIPHNGTYAKDKNDFDISHIPPFAPYANGNICEAHRMPNGGDIRNTDQRNTDQRNTYLRNTKSVSQAERDRQTDEIREMIMEQIEFDYFEENYPSDVDGVKSIAEAMVDMLIKPYTKVNGIRQSRESLQPFLAKVDACILLEFLEHMRSKDTPHVKNVQAYWQTSLINFLREQELQKLKA